MAKKKEVEAAAVFSAQAPDSGVANPGTSPMVGYEPLSTPDTVIAEVDFNELLELEKATRQTTEQFDKIAGNIERLKRDLDLYHNHEKTLNNSIEAKRKDIIKRYNVNEQRSWRIDINSRKIVYQD